MAVGQSLRYYRQQFNPENAFESAAGGSPIISMYNPEQQARFLDAVQQVQSRYDAGVGAFAAEKARIGETETYDLPELNRRLKAFESSINDIVGSKYNGDYGAAANEIAKMIGTERSNPFYHFNKQKVEMSKAYLDAKMKLGSNFMSTDNPLEVTFEDWQNGKKFEFTPINREDIVKASAVEFSSLANTIMNNPTLQSTAGGQYFLTTMQYGLKDPQAVADYLNSAPGQEMVNNIVANNPELAKLPREQVMSAIAEGAHSAIGKTVKDYMTDQSYLDRLKEAKLAKEGGESGYFNMIAPGNGIATKGYMKGNKDGLKLAGIESFYINDLMPSRMSTSDINEQEKIKENLSNRIKEYTLTDTPSQFVDYISRPSRRNIEDMDRSKSINITDIALDPENPRIIIGFEGYNKEGKPLEAGIALDAGSKNPNSKVLSILPYLLRLGSPEAMFNQRVEAWISKHYPELATQFID